MNKSSEYVICMKMRQTFHELLLSLFEQMLRKKWAFVNILRKIHMGEILKQLPPVPAIKETEDRSEEKVTNPYLPLKEVKN